MSEFGEAIDEARAAIGENAADIFPDVCTVSIPGAPVASRGQFTNGAPTTIANVPCGFEALQAYERAAGGAVTADADHVLEFPVIWQNAYLNVPATATVEVAARGLNPARTFQVTGPLPTSTSMKQRVAATLKG